MTVQTLQPSLFDQPAQPHFDGETYCAPLDEKRLGRQYTEVFNLMRDGTWRTIEEIQRHVKGSETAISARLRDSRKSRFGSHTVLRRRRGEAERGIHEYKLIPNEDAR